MRISDWSSDVCSSVLLAVVDEGRERHEVLVEGAGESGDDPLGLVAVIVLAGQMEEPREDPDQGAVAGRRGAVGGGHGAGDEVRRVVGGEVIAAGRARVMRVEDCDPGRSEEHTYELQSP